MLPRPLPSRRPRRPRLAALLASGCLLVAGCSGGGADDAPDDADASVASDPPSSTGVGPTAAEPGADDEPVERAPRPAADGCYALGPDQVARAHTDAAAVACTQAHTTATYLVGRLRSAGAGDADAGDVGDTAVRTEAVAREADRRCARAVGAYLGGDGETRTLSRFDDAWFVPTEAQLAAGSRWFRCDLVARGADGTLVRLPADTEGLLDAGDALDSWGTCAVGADDLGPEAGWVPCSEPHDWQAVGVRRVGDRGDRWPGDDALSALAPDCEADVREATGSSDDLTLQWSWPTRAQWGSGRRHGLCWTADA